MEHLFIFGTSLIITSFMIWSWVEGIDKQLGDFPDYKGEDLLDEYPPKKEQWDDNKQHTEQHFKL
jgi:hypothetical protein